jgi:4-hydroxythreonine-4-phosphate dehydrogenase
VTADLPVIVVTSGEPAGIGPDICLALAKHHLGARLAVLADHGLLVDRARALGARVTLRDCDTVAHVGPHLVGSVQIMPIALRAPVAAGRLDVANAAYVLDMLRRGAALCSAGAA